MLRLLSLIFGLIVRTMSSRRELLLENLALRQQLAALERNHPQPRFQAPDKFFWILLRRFWPGWKQALLLVQPETVVRWHRAGFKHLLDARSKITGWRKEYNEVRPHSSLDYRTPNQFAQVLRDGGMKNAYGVSHAAIPPSNT